MTFQNEWFHDRDSIKFPPPEAVRDCTTPGPVDEAVAHWVQQLRFDGPAWHIRDFLGEYGAWDNRQLSDHKENLERLFWIWCENIAEEVGRGNLTEEAIQAVPLYLGL